MALAIATITDSIAALSVSGVEIRDIDQIPSSLKGYNKPVIFPEPIDFIADPLVTRANFGTGSSQLLDINYTINYQFCYMEVGSLWDLRKYAKMVEKAFLFWDTINSNDTVSGLIDLRFSTISNFGIVLDPAGNTFHGTSFGLRVLEHADDN
jgi:hypothetical protein